MYIRRFTYKKEDVDCKLCTELLMSKYCLFLIVIYYLTGGNNSMSRFFKFGKLHFLITEGME